MKWPLEIGKAHGGLYYLCSDCLQQTNPSSSLSKNSNSCLYFPSSRLPCPCVSSVMKSSHSCSSCPIVMNSISINNKNNVVENNSSSSTSSPVVSEDLLWHYKLGHVLL